MVTDRTSPFGTSAAAASGAWPSRTTETRRSFSVSAASGVIWPPLASSTVSPQASTRAAVAVIISKRFTMVPREILISEQQIQSRVAEMAADIRRDFADDVHLIAVLKGAFIFLSDLVRHIPGRVSLDFMATSSYAKGTTTSGEVKLVKDLDLTLDGRNVIIVEDIVDSGLTLHYLHEILRARNPKSLRTACLLNKPSRRKIEVPVEYVGFTIDDQFVVGYGLDYEEQYRQLPHIGVVS